MSDPARRSEPLILAIANQKGGVGKTTTAINLAAGLVELGARVLLVDLDPQGNASTGLGIGPEERQPSTYDLLVEETGIAEVIRKTRIDNLLICPANSDLSSADIDLVSNEKRSFLLHDALRQPAVDPWALDFILIDCPPSLSLLTVNALVASHAVLVPLQAEFYALEGLSQLLLTVRKVRQSANPALRIEGVVVTMFDGRNRLCQQVESDARATLGDLVYKTVIPRNVRLSEAPSYAMPVLQYDPASRGSEAYRNLSAEVMARHPIAEMAEGEAKVTEKKAEKRGLGRGLSALMADVAASPEAETGSGQRAYLMMPVDRILPNPDQPRRDFPLPALEDLAASVRQKGVVQPLILRPLAESDLFQIVAGERRWRAAQMAGLHEVPVIVRAFDDAEVIEIAIIENIQRSDLNALEEALAYRQLIDKFGHTQEKLAEALSRSRSHVANLLRLLTLPVEVQDMLRRGDLSPGHARALITSPHPARLAAQVVKGGLSVRETERLAKAAPTVRKVNPPGRRHWVEKDADTRAIEADLAANLKMLVRIDHNGPDDGGRLTVHYRTLDDLDMLCDVLSKIPRDVMPFRD